LENKRAGAVGCHDWWDGKRSWFRWTAPKKALSGEAGIGKSRLAAAVTAIAQKGSMMVLVGCGATDLKPAIS
jgi:hypothetical protein